MTSARKTAHLESLDESAFRRTVLIPLLNAIGFADVREHHGPREKGKDLLWREATRLQETEIYAAVVVVQDINGKVGDSRSALKVLEQVRMALDEPYADKYTGRETHVDRCWVITSHSITTEAIESVCSHLQKYNLGKLVRFFDGARVRGLIDKHFPQYWERERELVYLPVHDVVDISTNHVDPPYDRDVDDLPEAGSLRESIHSIKVQIRRILMDWELDIEDHLVAILRSNDPITILTMWDKLRAQRTSHGGFSVGSQEAQEISRWCDYLDSDVAEYRNRYLDGI